MEILSKRSKKESIKSTMLKHAGIFKQQVEELHRLYEVQKKLMSELKSKELNKCSSYLATYKKNRSFTSETSHSSQASVLNDQSIAVPLRTSYEYKNFKERVDEESHESSSSEVCNLDLTLSSGCSKAHMRCDSSSSIFPSSNLNQLGSVLEEYSRSCSGFGIKEASPDIPSLGYEQNLMLQTFYALIEDFSGFD